MSNDAKNRVNFLGTGKLHRRFRSTKEIGNFVSDNREMRVVVHWVVFN